MRAGMVIGLAILFASSMLGACSGGDELTVADLSAEELAELDSLSCADPLAPLFQPAYFESMSAELDERSLRRLLQNVYVLSRCPDGQVTISGYTDFSPDESSVAEELSGKRAEAVYRFYRELGIPEGQIVCALAKGQEPRVSLAGLTEEEYRERNAHPSYRRVDTLLHIERENNVSHCEIFPRVDPR